VPPVIAWIVAAAGAALLAKWMVKETRRINAELHGEAPAAGADDTSRPRSTLERDPDSGIYRPR
jgi:hypothetical protein